MNKAKEIWPTDRIDVDTRHASQPIKPPEILIVGRRQLLALHNYTRAQLLLRWPRNAGIYRQADRHCDGKGPIHYRSGPGSTFVLSFISIHSAVWSQIMNVTDRQTDGHYDGKGSLHCCSAE